MAYRARFQSTRPRGRTRRRPFESIGPHSRFQSTRPRGRTRLLKIVNRFRVDSFNPRVLAGGRDKVRMLSYICKVVSIHASSREDATSQDNTMIQQALVSIHASSREDATDIIIYNDIPTKVSIHASSREDATSSPPSVNRDRSFQSTRPRGRTRPGLGSALPDSGCFNPRVLAGGRDSVLLTAGSPAEFQSTRPRGRTRLF